MKQSAMIIFFLIVTFMYTSISWYVYSMGVKALELTGYVEVFSWVFWVLTGTFIAGNTGKKRRMEPMPTSPYAHLYPLIEFLNQTRPSSLLDVGLGNDKIGFIARDFLDVMFVSEYKILHYAPGPYGAFLAYKEDYIDAKIKELELVSS